MADYDSATPLYEFLPNHWHNEARGKLPLAWGINPNLLETYPDLFAYFYSTATPADTFTADASAAGYMNPEPHPEGIPAVVRETQPTLLPRGRHGHRAYGARIGTSLRRKSRDAFRSSPRTESDHRGPMRRQRSVAETACLEGYAGDRTLINDIGYLLGQQKKRRRRMSIGDRGAEATQEPGFYFFRIVWVNPTTVAGMLYRCFAGSARPRHRRGRPERVFCIVQRARGQKPVG